MRFLPVLFIPAGVDAAQTEAVSTGDRRGFLQEIRTDGTSDGVLVQLHCFLLHFQQLRVSLKKNRFTSDVNGAVSSWKSVCLLQNKSVTIDFNEKYKHFYLTVLMGGFKSHPALFSFFYHELIKTFCLLSPQLLSLP